MHKNIVRPPNGDGIIHSIQRRGRHEIEPMILASEQKVENEDSRVLISEYCGNFTLAGLKISPFPSSFKTQLRNTRISQYLKDRDIGIQLLVEPIANLHSY